MKSNYIRILTFFYFLAFSLQGFNVFSQCATNIVGQNLVVNGDFSMGDTLFDTPYGSWNNPNDGATPCGNINPMTCPRFWSSPGEYWIHNNADNFNPGSFSSVPSNGSGGNMMMVDAQCLPGQTVWEQTVNVTAGKNHYFSLRIASIHPLAPAKLAFQVNGVTLGTLVNAPSAVNTWLFYEDVWNSGVLNGPVQLKIIEQSGVGCTNGDDFAIDDIKFIPGCQFGSIGPAPNLGPDQTLCGKGGSLVLTTGLINPTHANYHYTWSTGATTPTLTVTVPGTYSVCVDSAGSCLRSDVVVITNQYSINLGPDRNLCNPPTIGLDAGYSGPGVTYLWTLNGSPLPGATNKLYTANQTGTYSVQVNDPVCGAREDEIVITSSTVSANNAQFCTTPTPVGLSINGLGGTYNWYSAPTGGTLLQSNSTTYTTPPISTTTTYYVEDASSFNYTVGPATNLSGWGRSGDLANTYLRFNALTPFVLDYVTVYAYNGWNSNFNVSIVLANSAGTVLATSTAVAVAGSANTTMHRIPVGISVPIGTDLRMYAITSGGQLHYDGGSHPSGSWPYQVSGVVSIHSNVSNGSVDQVNYNHLYNWEISSGAICARVPVTAVQFCPPSCNPPSAATISNPSPVVMCTAGSVILNASVNVGYEYTWLRNGIVVAGPTVNQYNYTATSIGNYAVRITEAGNPFCFLQSATVQVVEFNLAAVNLIPDYTTCDPSQTLDALVSGSGVTYTWERNAILIPGATSQTYTISNLGAYRVWVNHPTCGMATDVVVVGPGTYTIGLGSDRNLCTPTAYTLDAGFSAAGVTYQWQTPVGTNITGATSQTYYVNAPGTYRILVTHPFCGNQMDDIVITSSLGTPTNDTYCSDDVLNNTATLGMSGAGPYNWYANSTGGAVLGTGPTYTTPVISGNTTYYVESSASFKYNKGPKNVDSKVDPSSAFPLQTYRSGGGFNSFQTETTKYVEFTALTNMTFDSVTVYPRYIGWQASYFIRLNVRDVTTSTDNIINYNVSPNTYNCGGGCNNPTPDIAVRVPIQLNLISGRTYRIMGASTNGTQLVFFQPGSGPAIPINTSIFDEPSIVNFIDYQNKFGCNCQYPGFFDFVFSSGIPCNRVPVVATDLAPCVLPVTWIDFTVTSKKNDVLLEWITAKEVNNDYFSIERSSDGIHWETIGMVDGKGTTNTISNYSFIDENPLAGAAYYRITQIDFNGAKDQSQIKSINRATYFSMYAVPNPFNESTSLFIKGIVGEKVEIEIIDANGKLILSLKEHIINNDEPIDFGKGLAAGLYLVKVFQNETIHTSKIIKN